MSENQGPEEVPFARVWGASGQPPPVPVQPIADPPPIPPDSRPMYPSPQTHEAYPDYMGAGSGAGGRMGKPAVITTIGILSIIFASFSMIGSGVSAAQAMIASVFSQMSANMARLNASAANASAAASAMQTINVGPLGLPWDDRQTAVNVIASRQPLTPERLAQLDGLLADGGQIILGVQPGEFASNDVRAAIKSTSRGKGAGAPGPDLIVTTSGTIELYDANAVFRPVDHAQPVIRVAADAAKYALMTPANGSPLPAAAPTSPPAPLPVFAKIDTGAVLMVLVESGLSLLLAIYLLVIGILTLRGSPNGGRLHLIFALLKLPLIALAAYASVRLANSIFTSVATATSTGSGRRIVSPPNPFFAGMGVTAILAAAYPVALLILLTTRGVRDYYRKPHGA